MIRKISAFLPADHPWREQIVYLPAVDSTNTYAKDLARQGAPSGTVVIADAQSGGRGRMGRSFCSPAGLGLYFSLVLRPQCPAKELMHLTCAAGLAAALAVEDAAQVAPDIKWTNDLVLNGRKLGGILAELSIDPMTAAVDYAVIGIGINCHQILLDFPAPLQATATSLRMAGADISRAALAAALINRLCAMERDLLSQRAQTIADFRKRCITVGRDISLIRGDSLRHAHALDVDEAGGLLVQYPDGSREVIACGEVSVRGMYGYL